MFVVQIVDMKHMVLLLSCHTYAKDRQKMFQNISKIEKNCFKIFQLIDRQNAFKYFICNLDISFVPL